MPNSNPAHLVSIPGPNGQVTHTIRTYDIANYSQPIVINQPAQKIPLEIITKCVLNSQCARSEITLPDAWITILSYTASSSVTNGLQHGYLHYLANPTLVYRFREAEWIHPNHVIEAVLHGDETMVKNILNVSPHYLLKTGTATDFSGRTFTTTPFQAALCAGDVEMCQMMKKYFNRLPNGQTEMQKQYQEIFPDGIEAHEIEQKRNVFNFNRIVEAIKRATPAELDSALNKEGARLTTESNSARAKPDSALSLTEALNRFREQFTQLSHCEKIFNPCHLLHAWEVLNTLWNQYKRDDSDHDNKKYDLFWRQIIGYIQRFMPACYAQAFAQGLYNLVKVDQDASWRPEPFTRTLKLKDDDNFSYFPLLVDSRSGLGFDFAIYTARWATCGRLGPDCTDSLAILLYVSFFKNFCRAKTASWKTHYAARTEHVTDTETSLRSSVA